MTNRNRVLWVLVAATALLARWAEAAVQVEAFPERPSPGEVFHIRFEGAARGAQLVASFTNRTFSMWNVSEGTWEGLVAVDRDEPPGAKELWIIDQSGGGETLVSLSEVHVIPRDYPEQRLTVSERMVTLSAEDQERAARERRIIRKALSTRTKARLWEGPFLIPLEGRVSSPFGVRRFYNDKPRGYHSGLDIAAPRGAAVRGAAAGRVLLAGNFFYTGNTVFVDHGLGLLTAYFHMNSVSVSQDQAIEAGDVVGTVGSTGRSTGPHLHWGVYLAGVKTDPMSLVRAVGSAVGGGEIP